jgi:cytochrome c-type biogenesis protein CcmH
VLGQHDKAVPAFRKAAALRQDDAALLADFADALAMTLGRTLEGEPLKLVEQALKIEPGNLKALSLAGTAAFNRKDYAAAVRYWEKMREVAPEDNVFVRQIEGGIAEARQLGGLPPAQPKPGGAAATATGEGRVSGKVTLAPALAAKASPEDIVFVFARPAEAAGMPLAILRRQVKDLPMEFTLDDSMSLSPATKLSSQSRVVVGARISKTGQATPQPGDLQGQTAAVALGSSGLKIEVGEVVGR